MCFKAITCKFEYAAGPIERAANLLPQFRKKIHFDYRSAADGLMR